jgi:CBS domain-containing protein
MAEKEPDQKSATGWPFKELPMNVETVLPAARDRLVRISEASQLTQAAALFGQNRTDLIVVCNDDDKMVGVVSKTDIVSRISQCQGHACTTMVASVMTRDVVCCRPGDRLHQAWDLMKEKGFLHIPIVDSEGRPLGTLYARDALQALLGEVEYEEELLRDYVMCIGYH